ncbi:ATP-dependent helicase [Alteribacter natronophilus]|uniref:ATP-dependent helicase n=1 Tax=Alteribacter natronophilus TaxID=2583810 RepID=UPI00110F5751|nr:ATP-dependent helicase [Alteribacter natronophilus]TMW72958.1 ATP-dependent helicase [Alteribacter natronophilus]
MQRAIHNKTTWELSSLERGKLSFLDRKSRAGELVCPYCGLPAVLQVSLNEPPVFVHRNGGEDPACEQKDRDESLRSEEVSAAVQEQAASREKTAVTVGAFSLPASKPIGTAVSDSPSNRSGVWKKPVYFKEFQSSLTEPELPASPNPVLREITSASTPLNDRQQEAVLTTDGPLLLLAGAGSGKTRVITARAAYMLKSGAVRPEQMMLVTFTQKAAAEMKNRLASSYGLEQNKVRRIVSGTFHSLFYKMLMHDDYSRWQPERLLKAHWQKEKIVMNALRELKIDERDFAVDQALTTIGAWKNAGLSPEKIKPEDAFEEQVKDVYAYYEKEKAEMGKFDFDDMLTGCRALLDDNPELLAKYQKRFTHVMIDEFQDINRLQYEIIKKLAAPEMNLCAVGDDDQSIYRFRGSDPEYILRFESTFPGTNRIHLDANYRSEPAIVNLANDVIKKNTDRYPKKMKPVKENDHLPLLFFPYDEEEEAIFVTEHIRRELKKTSKPEDFAILYRSHVQARAIFERLIESGLPFTMEQGSESFYDRNIVRKALSYLRLAVNGDDVDAMQDWLRVMFLKNSLLNELKRHTIFHGETMLGALHRTEDLMSGFQTKKVRKAAAEIPHLASLPPEKALFKAYEELGLKDFIRKNGREGNKMERGSDDYHELSAIASGYSSVSEFLAYVNHIRAKVNAHRNESGNGKGIQLMTVHRAKGLEFPNVFVLGCNDGSLPHEYALEKNREGDCTYMEEERRLMYVAATRAQQRLFLSSTDQRRGKKAYRSRFLNDLRFRTSEHL